MRGVRIHKQGQPAEVYVEDNLLLPALRDADVLIQVEYSGASFIDIYQRQGVYPVQVPITAGREGAGTIVQLGSKVPDAFGLQLGDPVAIFTQGTMAEYVAAPAEGVMKLA